MNDSQCLTSIRLFLAAIWQLRRDDRRGRPDLVVPYDVRAFARALGRDLGEGHPYAERFLILGHPGNRTCPDFNRGMDLARSAGLMHRCEGGFHVDMMQRTILVSQRDVDYAAMTSIAAKYLEEVDIA